jgi:nitrite reductase/ring-hydroxylating ferredoxin subunit
MVICPLHERRFDLITGQCLNGSRGLEIFPVQRTEDG